MLKSFGKKVIACDHLRGYYYDGFIIGKAIADSTHCTIQFENGKIQPNTLSYNVIEKDDRLHYLSVSFKIFKQLI